MGTIHSPGMQYLTGGAMTATKGREGNKAGFSLAEIQLPRKKHADWRVCHVTAATL